MQLQITPELFTLFPDAAQYTLVANGVDNQGECPELLARLREAEAAIRNSDAFADIKAHPRIASWRDAFQVFGINPNRCPPSVANLIKRTRSGNDLPFVSKLVCIFNIISLTYVVPAGGDDLAQLKGDLTLGPAAGNEIYIPLGGGEQETPKEGEVILYDSATKHVFCRAWCWKNGDFSKILPESSRVSINIDVLPPFSLEDGRKAMEDLSAMVKTYCGCEGQIYLLDKNTPSIAL